METKNETLCPSLFLNRARAKTPENWAIFFRSSQTLALIDYLSLENSSIAVSADSGFFLMQDHDQLDPDYYYPLKAHERWHINWSRTMQNAYVLRRASYQKELQDRIEFSFLYETSDNSFIISNFGHW